MLSSHYDAFISYRHLPFDKKVAERLQTLLETYKPPKGITGTQTTGRIFRDQSELPTSGDLDADIKEALRQSRFLIVVCSEETKHSPWCLQEIDYFKSLHGGRCDNILTLLIAGTPQTAFPDALRFETRTVKEAESGAPTGVREIEPLAANIVAASQRSSLRLLATEFLRIAAPILGCGYDDLFGRHHRRRVRTITGTASVLITLMLAVTITVLAFERAGRNAMALLYYKQGIESIERDQNDALGMMYFADSLSLRPQDTAAPASGLALLMQNRTWPFVAASAEGRIMDDALILPASARPAIDESTAVYVSDDIPLKNVVAYDRTYNQLLVDRLSHYEMVNTDGRSVKRFDGELQLPTSPDNCVSVGCWVFTNAEGLVVYSIETGDMLTLERPAQVNPLCDVSDVALQDDGSLSVTMVAYDGGRRVAMVCAGYLYFYQAWEDRYVHIKTLDLADEFDNIFMQDRYLSASNDIYIDQQERIVAITNYRSVCFVSLPRLESLFTVEQNHFMVADIAFNEEGTLAAIGYGADLLLGIGQGGHAVVYDIRGEIRYSTESLCQEPISLLRFNASGDTLLTFSYTRQLRLWNLHAETMTERCAPIRVDSIEQSAVFCADYWLAVADHLGFVRVYAAVKPAETRMAALPDPGYPILATLQPEKGTLALVTMQGITFLSEAANAADTGTFINADDPAYEAFLTDHAFELQHHILLNRMDPWVREALIQCVSEDVFTRDGLYVHPGSYFEEIRVSMDGTRVYAVGSMVPFFVAYDIDSQNRSLTCREVTLFQNEVPTALWQSNDGHYIALATDMNELWLYKNDALGSPYAILQLRNTGSVDEIAVDATGSFLAVSLKRYDPQDGFLPYGLLEIWDIGTRTHVIEITDNRRYINGLRFIADYLYYGMDNELHRLWLPGGKVDTRRIDFFKGLSGYRLDKELAPVARNPVLTIGAGDGHDTWAQLYQVAYRLTPEESEITQANENLAEVLTRLNLLYRLNGEIDLLGNLSEMETWLLDDWMGYELSDLFSFYTQYLREWRKKGSPEHIPDLIKNYLTLCERWYHARDLAELGTADLVALDMLPSMYTAMLVYGTDYDALIIDALENWARYQEAYLETNITGDEMTAIHYQSTYLQNIFTRSQALLLRQDYDGAIAMAVEHGQDEDWSMELYVDPFLLLGDAETAGVVENELLYRMRLYGVSVDAFSYRLTTAKYYAYEKRGMMTRETIYAFLDILALKAAYQVCDMTGYVRESELKKGDMIVAVNDERIYCLEQLHDLIDAHETYTLQVLRQGLPISITLTKSGQQGALYAECVMTPYP